MKSKDGKTEREKSQKKEDTGAQKAKMRKKIQIYTCKEHTRVYKYTIPGIEKRSSKIGAPSGFQQYFESSHVLSDGPMNLAHVRNPSGSGHKTRNRTVKEEMRHGYDRWRRLAAPGCSSPVDLELGIFFPTTPFSLLHDFTIFHPFSKSFDSQSYPTFPTMIFIVKIG